MTLIDFYWTIYCSVLAPLSSIAYPCDHHQVSNQFIRFYTSSARFYIILQGHTSFRVYLFCFYATVYRAVLVLKGDVSNLPCNCLSSTISTKAAHQQRAVVVGPSAPCLRARVVSFVSLRDKMSRGIRKIYFKVKSL